MSFYESLGFLVFGSRLRRLSEAFLSASLLLGLFSFTLPNTPPPAKGKKVSAASIIGVDAFKQLASPAFFIFLLSSFLICIPLAAYYNFTQHFLKATGFEKIASAHRGGRTPTQRPANPRPHRPRNG